MTRLELLRAFAEGKRIRYDEVGGTEEDSYFFFRRDGKLYFHISEISRLYEKSERGMVRSAIYPLDAYLDLHNHAVIVPRPTKRNAE